MAKKSKKESTLYYFHSAGCGFCKQVDPIIEKLNSEGYDILSLDMSEKDNQGLHREIENKYDITWYKIIHEQLQRLLFVLIQMT